MLKRNIYLIAPLIGLLLSFADTFPAQDEIQWFESYPEALREAQKSHKPIFLEFRCEP